LKPLELSMEKLKKCDFPRGIDASFFSFYRIIFLHSGNNRNIL
jgi:hypothetical protein